MASWIPPLITFWMKHFLKLRYNRQQKRATCFAAFPQKELYSDVARFTAHIKSVLQQMRLLQIYSLLSAATFGNQQRPYLFQDRFDSLFIQFCSNFAKQVARFFAHFTVALVLFKPTVRPRCFKNDERFVR